MRRSFLIAAALWSVASIAYAHPGHIGADSFSAGFMHPLTGVDHMLAMIAVGIWARFVTPGQWWAWPAAFVTLMAAGFGYGAMGGSLIGAEVLIAGSLIAFGAAIALKLKPSLGIGAAIVGVFAVAHGYAHGAEMPAGAHVAVFCAGFALATAALHLAGVALADGLLRLQARVTPAIPLVRLAGMGVALGGLCVAALH
ncbi:MAG: HupE/UreJ family protein [Alphaproteobacteria bacterium]